MRWRTNPVGDLISDQEVGKERNAVKQQNVNIADASRNVGSWTFENDERYVGELTKVIFKTSSGMILEGWATITSHQSLMAEGDLPGMCVVGPVFATKERSEVLDSKPLFCRIDRV